MKRVLHLEIELCGECPFVSYDSRIGWYCMKANGDGINRRFDRCRVDRHHQPPKFCPLPKKESEARDA